MEVSRISSKGQVTIPKTIREILNLSEGERVALIEENGKIFITKASLVTLRDLQEAMSKETCQKGITEQDLLNELKQCGRMSLATHIDGYFGTDCDVVICFGHRH
ncbi:AbrB/MazE/SpoVT family DNA-binding domain-containing protein [Paenibacillus sp. P26]|nr:AbrB/MazE/SpoVT family DNA-binding domain-containing protein [Paenibacillus sp. P26]UUZ93768.1 AbrB/MazE/SpoVT family DNA-binding domain-containing protein [Paenibacillus sp. P25]